MTSVISRFTGILLSLCIVLTMNSVSNASDPGRFEWPSWYQKKSEFSPSDLQRQVDDMLGRGSVDANELGYTGLIQCVFNKIEVEKKDQWFPATAPAFGVAPGETVDIKVRRRFGDGSETIHVTWDTEDSELKFCKRPGSGSCQSVRVDGRGFARGRTIDFTINEEARGTASCGYAG